MQVQTLGRYRIVRELGRGAMGRVFLAHDPEIDRQIAIKTIQIFASLPEDERAKARERFLREARSAGKLLHPGIVTVFDVGEADGLPYIAMEYVEGQTLDAFCRPEDLLPVDSVVELTAKVAEALAFAHHHGIVHRDIKPSNLMRVGETSVKIMDFGIAKNPQTQLTQDGALLGTPNYMSPEQIRGDRVDNRSDLFSLGVALYELMTGEKPFPGESISSVLYRIVNEEPRDLAVHHQRVPASIESFLHGALAKKPEDRFSTGAEFAAALREAGGEARAAAPSAGRQPRPARRSERQEEAAPPPLLPHRSSRLPYMLAAAFVILALGGAAVFLRSRGGIATQPMRGAVSLETHVRTEPRGLPVSLDGSPLEGDTVRLTPDGPFGLLEVRQDCRTATHRLTPEDAGGDVVLVPDPVHIELLTDPGVAGAKVRLNGHDVGPAPTTLELDLCRENRIELRAEGYQPVVAAVAAGATSLEARTAVTKLHLESIPKGRILFPDTQAAVTFFVDGRPVQSSQQGLEVSAGRHEVRAVSEEHWIDLRTNVQVGGGETARPSFAVPRLALLEVQAFPPNCRVELRREGEDWRYLDDVPVTRRVAAGRYHLKVEYSPTGETREQEIELEPGPNPPIRMSFGRARR